MTEATTPKTKCDLCPRDAEYHLCQDHMDDSRFPETYSTKDGDYPRVGQMVLFQGAGDVLIGGFDKDNAPSGLTGWFDSDGYLHTGEIDFCDDVIWCELQDLNYLHRKNENRKSKFEKANSEFRTKENE